MTSFPRYSLAAWAALVAVSCSLPCAAQQPGHVAPTVVAPAPAMANDPAGDPAGRHAIIVVGGKPAAAGNPSVRDTGTGALNPQPLPPRPPHPPTSGSASPPHGAGRAGIIVVGGRSGQPAVEQAQPGAAAATRSKRLPTTGRQGGQ